MKERNLRFLNNINLRLFDNTNVTGDTGLVVELKTFYDKALIKNAQAVLVHDQFGQKRNIPKNGGKTIEFRKYNPLGKALTPLVEGVTPAGQKLNVTKLEATLAQYGGYVELSDVLDLTAIDNNIVEATKLIGTQAGETLDTIVREVLNGGTNVQYAEGQVAARNLLTASHKLTVKAIQMAARYLKTQKAQTINGSYVGIIHPDISFDLMRDPEFMEWNKYTTPDKMFNNEIGKIGNVRFVETTESKIFAAAGAGGISVYSTLILGADAYGVTETEGDGLQHITKQLGSGGTTDPLNQRATVGWKAMRVAERLVENYMIRIETGGTFSGEAN